jgi:hypothetical protein
MFANKNTYIFVKEAQETNKLIPNKRKEVHVRNESIFKKF